MNRCFSVIYIYNTIPTSPRLSPLHSTPLHSQLAIAVVKLRLCVFVEYVSAFVRDDVMGGDKYCTIVWLYPGCKY